VYVNIVYVYTCIYICTLVRVKLAFIYSACSATPHFMPYIYIQRCTYIYIYVYICMYTRIYTYIFTYSYVLLYVCRWHLFGMTCYPVPNQTFSTSLARSHEHSIDERGPWFLMARSTHTSNCMKCICILPGNTLERYIHIYAHIYIYIYVYLCMHTYMYIYIYVSPKSRFYPMFFLA